jgi:hypothetical protein
MKGYMKGYTRIMWFFIHQQEGYDVAFEPLDTTRLCLVVYCWSGIKFWTSMLTGPGIGYLLKFSH